MSNRNMLLLTITLVVAACSSEKSESPSSGRSSSGAGGNGSTTVGAGGNGNGGGGVAGSSSGNSSTTTNSSTTNSSTTNSSTTNSSGATGGGGGSGAGGTTGGAPPDASADASRPPDASKDGAGGSGGSGPGDAAPTGTTYVYVSGNGGSIVTFVLDTTSGTLTPRGTPTLVATPSFLAWRSPTNQLYALSETNAGRVSAYSVNAATGALALLNDVASAGAGPAYVLAEPSGKWVFVANYGGGTAAVLPVLPNGSLGAAVDTQTFGSDTMPHEVVLDPSGQFAFVPLLGANAVAQFRFDRTAGKLMANTPARIMTAAGAGPRHMAFHPNGRFVYLANETVSTMLAYTHDTATGRIAEIQSLSTRAANAAGMNTAAEVAVHGSGKWLYGSNRGDNNIAQYALGETDGKMTLVGHTDTGGNTPRHFSIDPSGRFLLVINQLSNNVVVFRIAADGTLQRAGNPTPVAGVMPTFVGAVVLP